LARRPQRVREALEGARLWEFVSSQPEGIWSEFGEQGRRLSGGQLQRVGIARALYRRPNLLILDEATSALDNETEAEIAETIDNLSGKITVIIVAHRLSTIRNADQIVFLANGVVDGIGSFIELQERSEGFRNLVKLAALERAWCKKYAGGGGGFFLGPPPHCVFAALNGCSAIWLSRRC